LECFLVIRAREKNKKYFLLILLVFINTLRIFWYNTSVGKRGIKPKGKVKIKWDPYFAYAIGLITSDGNLSPDGRHISLTSKDYEIVKNFIQALSLTVKIGKKSRGGEEEKKYFVVQFGDVLFYDFLVKIGLTPAKSKTLKLVKIPKEYFFDFLRGYFDGDGSFYSYLDKRWRSSFMFYSSFVSASEYFIDWLKKEITSQLSIQGHVTKNGKVGRKIFQLRYAKSDSIKLLKRMYKNRKCPYLSRKRLKIEKALSIIGQRL